jgi:hypothetical protein
VRRKDQRDSGAIHLPGIDLPVQGFAGRIAAKSILKNFFGSGM